jgi:hypothetical protein
VPIDTYGDTYGDVYGADPTSEEAPVSWYLGKVGSLVEFRVNLGVQANPSKGVVVHELPRGRAVDVFPIKRTWTLPARQLSADQRSVIDRVYWLPGPWRLLDTNQRNLLTVNQSTGTDDLLATTGFLPTSGTLTSTTSQFRSGTNSLQWAVSSGLAAGNGVWTGSAATTTAAADDVPVVVGKDYTWSYYVRHSTSTVQMAARINWFTAAGVSVSSNVGSNVASSTANFDARPTVTATAPATAAYARPEAEIGVAPGAIMNIFLDELQFEQSSAVSSFVVGYGVPIVTATELDALLDRQDRTDYALTLVEL